MTERRKSVVAVLGDSTPQTNEKKRFCVKLGDGGGKKSVVFCFAVALKNILYYYFCRERRGVGKSHDRERRGVSKREQGSEGAGRWRRLGQECRGSRGAQQFPLLQRVSPALPPVLGAGGAGISLSMRERTGARAAAPRGNEGRSGPELLGQASFLLLRGKTRQQNRSYALSHFKIVGKL